MHVISRKALRTFWQVHPAAEQPLRRWERRSKTADWSNFADVRKTFGSADQVDRFIVFNIGGNKYRLIAEVFFSERVVLVRSVLTHKDCDRDNWKIQR